MRFTVCILVICLLIVSSNAIEILRGQVYGQFETPNHPSPYANNLEKEWRIEVKEGFIIKIRFSAFDLEDSYDPDIGACIYDYVTISEEGKEIARFCGNPYMYPMDAPQPDHWFYSTGNTVTVKFVSDYSNENISPTGFQAHYIEEDIDECAEMKRKEMYTTVDWDKLVTCNHFCHNIPASYYCSCRAGFTLHENEHTCVATFCENKLLTADEGMIKSPDYPQPYAKLSHCTWNIQVREGLLVHLTFDEKFDIEKHPQHNCSYDILKITHNNEERKYCGDTAPNDGAVMDMNTTNVKIEFTTDLSIEKEGFRISYNTSRIKCFDLLSSPTNGLIMRDFSKGFHHFEDVVHYACNRGYDLIGESQIECLSNGKWSHPEPTCKIKSCGSPNHLIATNYSHIVEDLSEINFTYLDIITVKCDPWYAMKSGAAKWVCEDSKQWEMIAESLVAKNNDTNKPKCRPKCGQRLVKDDATSGQISDGKIVEKPGGWPWMAFIDMKGTNGGRNGQDYCGGTLVDEMTVVTAAHCASKREQDDPIDVWLGLIDRYNDNFNFTQKFEAVPNKRLWPESYGTNEDSYFDEDIAIIKLDRPANLSYYVHPICVPQSEGEMQLAKYEKDREKHAYIIGWGETSGRGSYAQYLTRARIDIQNPATCTQRWEGHPKHQITQNMICAGHDKFNRDSCHGDSGGPLMTRTANKIYYLSGIVSFGDENACGQSEAPGVYTDVGKFQAFIALNMEK